MLVYEPMAGCMVDQVHLSFLGHGLRAPGSCAGGRRGEFPLFLPRSCSCQRRARWVSPHGGAGVQLRRGKVPSRRGDYDGGGRLTVKASQGSGHGERWIGVAVLNSESWTGRCGGWKLAWRGALASRGSSEQGGRDKEAPGAPSGPGHGGVEVVATAFVYLDHERGVFRGEEEPAKVVASPLPR